MKAPDGSPARQWPRLTRHGLGSRWLVMLVAALALATGLYLNWGWLVAAGLAPILLAVAPCAVMCALGLCAMKIFGGQAR